jgi:23S rRNA pseudouridine2605 synthase
VRRLFESQNLQVSRLIRIAYGPIRLGGGIRSGSYRELERDEIAALLAAVKLEVDTRPKKTAR